MLLPGENSPKTWLFLTILVSSIIAFSETSGGNKLDIKIGFDLTQGSNGAPSLRIRDFQDSTEFNPRAVDDASSSDESRSSNKKTSPRGHDSSGNEDHERPKKGENKDPVKPEKSGSSSSDDDEEKSSASREDKLRSTRGLKAVDFEPEEDNPKVHARYQKNSGSDAIDSDDESKEKSRRRYRRHIGRFA